ncbi:MAG: hypothetical protein ACK4UO_13010 [Pseudolabrys sp.]
MANTFKYQTVWTKEFQKSNWAMPIYPVIADLRFQAGLQIGDTVKRRYRSNPIFANDLGTDGSYSPQNYVEGEESFTISKQKEASVRIVKPEVLHTDLPATESYGKQLANALYQEIDGDTLNALRLGASQSISAGDFGGTSGDGLPVTISNIADLPVLAMEKYRGANVVYDLNKRFGKLAYENYDGMLTWIVPPQVWTQIDRYLIARNTQLGDQVTTNGYQGRFGNFNVFLSNNLPFTARLALSVNPTDGDTITIKGVVITFKTTVDAGTTAGQVKIASTAALTVTNLVAFLNAPTTTVADATNAGYNGFGTANTLTENGYTIKKSDALHGLSATDGTTYVDILMKGTGKVTVSSSFTSGSNLFTPALQIVHSIFTIGKNVSLAVRQDPEIYDNPVGSKIARDYVMWTVYDNKVFIDQARASIGLKVRCDATSFATYSNIHA